MKIDVDVDNKKYTDAWLGFSGNNWHREINVRDFIQQNYQPYEGDESFLYGTTPATQEL